VVFLTLILLAAAVGFAVSRYFKWRERRRKLRRDVRREFEKASEVLKRDLDGVQKIKQNLEKFSEYPGYGQLVDMTSQFSELSSQYRDRLDRASKNLDLVKVNDVRLEIEGLYMEISRLQSQVEKISRLHAEAKFIVEDDLGYYAKEARQLETRLLKQNLKLPETVWHECLPQDFVKEVKRKVETYRRYRDDLREALNGRNWYEVKSLVTEARRVKRHTENLIQDFASKKREVERAKRRFEMVRDNAFAKANSYKQGLEQGDLKTKLEKTARYLSDLSLSDFSDPIEASEAVIEIEYDVHKLIRNE
jgi:uncharacterized phage infection (PIP) family protein YhgE